LTFLPTLSKRFNSTVIPSPFRALSLNTHAASFLFYCSGGCGTLFRFPFIDFSICFLPPNNLILFLSRFFCFSLSSFFALFFPYHNSIKTELVLELPPSPSSVSLHKFCPSYGSLSFVRLFASAYAVFFWRCTGLALEPLDDRCPLKTILNVISFACNDSIAASVRAAFP